MFKSVAIVCEVMLMSFEHVPFSYLLSVLCPRSTSSLSCSVPVAMGAQHKVLLLLQTVQSPSVGFNYVYTCSDIPLCVSLSEAERIVSE